MMTELYSDSPYPLNPRRAAEAFRALLADERLGQVWFIQADSKDVGYVVVTFCYTMTSGGLSAVIDDFMEQTPRLAQKSQTWKVPPSPARNREKIAGESWDWQNPLTHPEPEPPAPFQLR